MNIYIEGHHHRDICLERARRSPKEEGNRCEEHTKTHLTLIVFGLLLFFLLLLSFSSAEAAKPFRGLSLGAHRERNQNQWAFMNDSKLLVILRRRFARQALPFIIKAFQIPSESCWCHQRNAGFLPFAAFSEKKKKSFQLCSWIFHADFLMQEIAKNLAVNDAKGGSTCPRSNLFSYSVILLKWNHHWQSREGGKGFASHS